MPTVLTFAPDTLIRFRGGRLLIHNTASPLPAFETESPMLIGWLCQFGRPVDAERLLAGLQPGDRNEAARIVEYLRNGRILVAPERVADPVTPETRAYENKQSLRLLARSIYEISCDIHALDPQADTKLRELTGLGIHERLMSVIASIDGLRSELASLSKNQIAEQLQTLGCSETSRNLKLHIGCGKEHLPGWINIDVYPAPLALNVLRGLPFAAGSAAYVFVSHLLEHLYFPGDVRPFLQELRRVLAPGGIVRIVVPDVERCIEAYTTNDRAFFESRRETWVWWPENPTRLEDFLAYSGAGPEPSYLFEAHKYGYDFETLSRVLRDVGFESIVQSSYMQSEHEALRVDEASAVAKAKYGDRYYSLFVEARSP